MKRETKEKQRRQKREIKERQRRQKLEAKEKQKIETKEGDKISPFLSLSPCRQEEATPLKEKIIFDLKKIKQCGNLDCPRHVDCLLLTKAHHPRTCVHCVTKKAIPGQRRM